MRGEIDRDSVRRCICKDWGSQQAFARAHGISSSHLSEFLSGKAVLSDELRCLLLRALSNEIEDAHAIVIQNWWAIKQHQVDELLQNEEFLVAVRSSRTRSGLPGQWFPRYYGPAIEEAYEIAVQSSIAVNRSLDAPTAEAARGSVGHSKLGITSQRPTVEERSHA